MANTPDSANDTIDTNGNSENVEKQSESEKGIKTRSKANAENSQC